MKTKIRNTICSIGTLLFIALIFIFPIIFGCVRAFRGISEKRRINEAINKNYSYFSQHPQNESLEIIGELINSENLTDEQVEALEYLYGELSEYCDAVQTYVNLTE